MDIISFTPSKQVFYPGDTFTLTVTAKNSDLSATAKYISLDAFVYVDEYPGSGYMSSISLYDISIAQDTSWASGATKTFTFSGTIDAAVYDKLMAALENNPEANVRANAIQWHLHIEADPFTTDDYTGEAALLLEAPFAPTIQTFSLERALDGLPNDEGESLLTTMQLSLAEKARMELISLKLYYAEAAAATTSSAYIDLTASIPDLLAGVTDSGSLITQTFGNTSNWSFLLVFGDEYESASAALSIPRAFANVHLSGASTGGVALGGFSTSEEGNPKFESHYPAYLIGGLGGVKLGNGLNYGYIDTTKSMPTGSWMSIYSRAFSEPGLYIMSILLEWPGSKAGIRRWQADFGGSRASNWGDASASGGLMSMSGTLIALTTGSATLAINGHQASGSTLTATVKVRWIRIPVIS